MDAVTAEGLVGTTIQELILALQAPTAVVPVEAVVEEVLLAQEPRVLPLESVINTPLFNQNSNTYFLLL